MLMLSWLVRDSRWRRFHVHRCLECRRTFADTGPGCWTHHRYDELPGTVQPLQLPDLQRREPRPCGRQALIARCEQAGSRAVAAVAIAAADPVR